MATKFQLELSWSASRAKEFERCKLAYWYNRYASWGWWTERPRGAKYEIMVQKNLRGLAAFTGTSVHDAIEHWFGLKEKGTTMTTQELYEDARARFREGWRESDSGAWAEQPNKKIHLFDHHYEIDLPSERTGKMREILERSAKCFCEHPELEGVRNSDPESWKSVESMDTYSFLGTKIYAVPDFAYQDGEVLHIWDWKTGRPREADAFQLRTYALYACEKWEIDPEDIVLHAAYLAKGEMQTISSTIEDLSHTQDVMSASLREMMDVHYDPDQDPVVPENWPATQEGSHCKWCNFQGVCENKPSQQTSS